MRAAQEREKEDDERREREMANGAAGGTKLRRRGGNTKEKDELVEPVSVIDCWLSAAPQQTFRLSFHVYSQTFRLSFRVISAGLEHKGRIQGEDGGRGPE